MRKSVISLFAALGMALPAPLWAQPAAPAPGASQADPLPKLTVDQALASETHPLARRVLELTKIMEATVVEGKQPGFGDANWAPFAARLDNRVFRRVGNFGEVLNWDQYRPMLTAWARTSWYTGRIRRISQVGNLVYLETEERSSSKGPFGESGGYNAFTSCAIYEFNPAGKITGLWIYDEIPYKNGYHGGRSG